MSFDRNVFINCPFDADYASILRPIVFTILYFDLNPRLASERLNSAEPRIDKIVELVRSSKFGIHDLSRIQAKGEGDLFRLNMPLELGIDLGSRIFGKAPLTDKRVLVLESKPYRYQAALSDLAGSDIEAHGDEPLDAMRSVRNWVVTQLELRKALGAQGLWNVFNDFANADYEEMLRTGHSEIDIEKRPISEMISAMREWIVANR